MTRVFTALLLLLASITTALAQSSPGLRFGDVPTAAQWNSYFAAKQDYLGFTPLSGNSILGSLPIVVTPSGSNVTVSCPTCLTTTPGSDTQIIYNNAGTLAGASTFTFNNTTGAISLFPVPLAMTGGASGSSPTPRTAADASRASKVRLLRRRRKGLCRFDELPSATALYVRRSNDRMA